MKDRLFEIWLSLRVGPANPAFIPLLEQYTPYDLFSMGPDAIGELPGDERLKQALCDKDLSQCYQIQQYCRKSGVRILFWQEEDYPGILRLLKDPPMLLYCKGRLPDLNRELCIAVVGTRTMSEYGKRMAYKIGYELGAAKAVTVSGLALGIDAMASAGALAAGGTSMVVLGCGIDIVYPTAHKTLMNEILRNGAVLTEYPPATRPLKHHFPQRNRLISGLCQGTVVVEAQANSGSLITAKNAIAQGRDIYAVPGNVGEENTSGTNDLIRSGANVVLGGRDILENYAFLYRDVLSMSGLTMAEKRSQVDEHFLMKMSVYYKSKTTEFPSLEGRGASDSPKAETEAPPSVKRRDPVSASPKTVEKASPKKESTPRKAPPPSAPREGDRSEEILKTLTDTQRRLFEALPLEHAVAVDYLMRSGFDMKDIMSAMTVLEIKGLAVMLPGGLFSRK